MKSCTDTNSPSGYSK